MISQKCPKCLSNRVRRGYRHTPIWSKLLFRYNLLCDNCNWEFIGFAVPGTVSVKPKSRSRRTRSKNTESGLIGREDDPEMPAAFAAVAGSSSQRSRNGGKKF